MDILDKFLNSQRSNKTKVDYKRNITIFMNFKNIVSIEDLKNIKVEDIDDWNLSLKVEGNSESTRKTKLASISSFYNFLLERDYVVKNPVVSIISRLKPDTKPQDFLTEDEVEKFLSVISSKKTYTIMYTLISTGLRVSELINVKTQDVKEDELTIRGKGGKYRTVYLNSKLQEAINNYISVRKDSPYDNLFISNKGTPLKTVCIDKTIKKITEKAGINKNISAHALRRTSATYYYYHTNKDVKTVQLILGHKDASTTLNRYIKPAEALLDIKNAMLSC